MTRMLTRAVPTALAALVATPLAAQTFEEQVIADLTGQGFGYIEIKTGPTQTKVEAVRGDTEVEVIYDTASGRILKQEVGRADADEIGRAGVEIDRRDRDFLDRADEDDDDDDDDDRGRGRGRGGDDDEDDRDDRGRDRDDDDDDDDDDRDDRDDDKDDDDDDDDDD